MNLYVILRRDGWSSPQELEEAAKRSADVGDNEMSDDIRWIRSYVLEEGSGSVGTVCIYQATQPRGDPQARRQGRPAGERDHPDRRHGIVRPDPVPAAS